MRSERPALSVVVPVYRSAGYLERTVLELVGFLEGRTSFEIVLVNDGSPDDVQAVIDRLCAADARVRGIALGGNVGQHRATLIGMGRARGEVVATVDDDGQNPPEAMWAVVQSLRDRDLDAVYGRFAQVRQAPLRRAASWMNRKVSAISIGNSAGIAITNVRALRGELARTMGAIDQVHPYIETMVFRATRRIGQVDVPHRPRPDGGSTYTLGRLVRLWFSHVTTLSIAPLKLATAGSFAASFLGFAVGAAQLVRVLLQKSAPPGWLSLFCAVTFLFGVLFAFLGILSGYVGRMYVASNARGLVWERDRGDAPDASRAAGGGRP